VGLTRKEEGDSVLGLAFKEVPVSLGAADLLVNVVGLPVFWVDPEEAILGLN
jgi:hypothetical protein